MIVFPNAKINIGLNIVEKRPDGYHNLETLFYPVPWEDALEVHALSTPSEKKCVLHLAGSIAIGDCKENLVERTYKLLNEAYDLPPIEVHLYKNIPSGAGLGGGSADAAFMLKLLNEKFRLGIGCNQLEEYCSQLGADCAFFIRNTPVLASGIGDKFTPVSFSLSGYRLVIVKPSVFVSTAQAFARIRPRVPEVSISDAIKHPIGEWKTLLKNDFEESVFPQHPTIEKIKEQLYDAGAVYASMSGSGSAVYGIFNGDDAPPTSFPHAVTQTFEL